MIDHALNINKVSTFITSLWMENAD